MIKYSGIFFRIFVWTLSLGNANKTYLKRCKKQPMKFWTSGLHAKMLDLGYESWNTTETGLSRLGEEWKEIPVEPVSGLTSHVSDGAPMLFCIRCCFSVMATVPCEIRLSIVLLCRQCWMDTGYSLLQMDSVAF